tara:strand:- start:999 stop:1271 length:273 start_codon:yes stop_codon:yes gene_type:complete
MSWRDIMKAERIDLANPIQYPRKDVAKLLRTNFSKTGFHGAVNRFVPELEGQFPYIDKRRAKQYQKLAADIRKISSTIKKLVTEYEGQEG